MSGTGGHSALREALHELVDGRLSGPQRETVERHLASCPSCRRELAALRAVKAELAAAGGSEPAPAPVARRIRAMLDEEDRAAARRRSPGWRWAAAAAVVAALGSAAWWLARPSTTRLPERVAGEFHRLAAGELALELATADPAELERFLLERGAPAARVFDFGMMGYGLAGGGRHELGREPAALFAYRGEAGDLILCLMYAGVVPSGAAEVRSHGGIEFHVFRRSGTTQVFWQEGSIACVLTSDIDSEALLELAFAKAVRV